MIFLQISDPTKRGKIVIFAPFPIKRSLAVLGDLLSWLLPNVYMCLQAIRDCLESHIHWTKQGNYRLYNYRLYIDVEIL